MKRQDIDLFATGRQDEPGRFANIFRVIIESGDQWQPEYQPSVEYTGQAAGVIKDQGDGRNFGSGYVIDGRFIERFKVKKDPVDVRQRYFIVFPWNIAAGFNGGMDESIIASFQKSEGKFRLNKGFATGECDASIGAPVRPVAADPGIEILRGDLISAYVKRPGATCLHALMGVAFRTNPAVEYQPVAFIFLRNVYRCMGAGRNTKSI